MKKYFFYAAIIALAVIGSAIAAETAKFDGEFVDKQFLNGQAVFEFSIHQPETRSILPLMQHIPTVAALRRTRRAPEK